MIFLVKPLEGCCREVFDLNWDSVLRNEEIEREGGDCACSLLTNSVRPRRGGAAGKPHLFSSRAFQVMLIKLMECQASLVPLCELEDANNL